MSKRSWRQFSIRALLSLMFITGVFFAGYRLGFDAARDASFDDLTELITATISPDIWDDIGGPADAYLGRGTNCFALTPASSESDDPFSSGTATTSQPPSDPFE